jgi:hypothetical protein
MGELKEAKSRWSRKMPKFFRIIMWVCGFVSGTALAVNTAIMAAGAQPHDWWVNIFPYLIGIPAGAMFACKFTVSGGMPGDRVIENHNTILDKDDN